MRRDAIEVHGGSGDEGHTEDSGKDLALITAGEFDFVPEEDRCGLGHGATLAVAQFIGCGLEAGAAALGAEGLIMDEIGHPGSGLQHDVFLAAGLLLLPGVEMDAAAVRTEGRGRHVDRAVAMIGRASCPRRMAMRWATFARALG